eukprot:313933_1
MNHLIHYEYKLNYHINCHSALMQRIGAAVMDIRRDKELIATIPSISNISSLSTARNEIVPSISSISSISLPTATIPQISNIPSLSNDRHTHNDIKINPDSLPTTTPNNN